MDAGTKFKIGTAGLFAVLTFLASVGPATAQSNLGAWFQAAGVDHVPAIVANNAADDIVRLVSAIIATAAITALWYSRKAKRIALSDDMELELIEGRRFGNEKIVLDGKRYVGCHMTNVTFIYAGGPFGLERNQITGIIIEPATNELLRYSGLLHQIGFTSVPALDRHGQVPNSNRFPDKTRNPAKGAQNGDAA